MSGEKREENQTTATTKKYASSDSELVYQFAKKNETSKNTNDAYQIPLHHLKDAVVLRYNLQSSSVETPSNSSIATIIETIGDHIRRRNGRILGDGQRNTTSVNHTELDEINMQLVRRSFEAFIDQMFLGRMFGCKDGVSSEFEFSDPRDILISNGSSFPQSLRFALRNSDKIKLSLDAKLAECGTRDSGDSGMLGYAMRNNKKDDDVISIKKVKDQYRYSSNRSSSTEPSNKIVVLRPPQKVLESPTHVTCGCSSLQTHQRLKSKGQNVKLTYFSFKEIKRRFRRAMGENQVKRQWISLVGSLYKLPTKKQINIGGSDQEIKADFSSRKPADSSTDTKRKNKQHEKRDFRSRNGAEITSIDLNECRKSKSSTGTYPKHHRSDIFQEAKKHLSERLRKVSKSEILEKSRAPRTLGRILSSPEHYDLFSPSSPDMDVGYDALLRETKSPCNKFSIKDDAATDGDLKILETNFMERPEDSSSFFEVPSVSPSNSFTNARPNLNCSALASPSHDQVVSSSSSLSMYNPEKVDTLKDKGEHQSPVSVLEPLFVEDASSPKSIATQPAAGTLQPLKIDFEYQIDPKLDTSVCINEEQSISAYVRAVLEESGLNWDESLLSRPSPDRVLSTSMAHGDGLFSTELHDDPELLFDCVSDVLIEVYQLHFGCSPWTSYLNPKIRSFQPENHLVDKVVKHVKHLLHPQLLQPTLDQLVGQDIARSASWLDIRFDAEELVNEFAEEILIESVIGTILALHT